MPPEWYWLVWSDLIRRANEIGRRVAIYASAAIAGILDIYRHLTGDFELYLYDDAKERFWVTYLL